MQLSYNSGVDIWKEVGQIVSWNFPVSSNPEALESLIGSTLLSHRNSPPEIAGHAAWLTENNHSCPDANVWPGAI